MKILFLDIDGVVNTGRNLLWLPSEMHHEAGSFMEFFDQSACHAVRTICEWTGCKVVINSTHGAYGEDHIRDRFMRVGYDISEDLYPEWVTTYPGCDDRGDAIHKHLKMLRDEYHENITHWCVIDDASVKGVEDHHVQTSSQNGIMMEDFDKACEILGKPYKGFVLI
jgi:hypothetical protein